MPAIGHPDRREWAQNAWSRGTKGGWSGLVEQPNVLIVVIDQLRADCVHGALSDFVDLPNIRALAKDGVLFDQHYSVTSPCGPSRVSLLTGQYAMNHRSVRNGTPARRDTPNLATELLKVGREPLLFGYTDTPPDPRDMAPDDPRLFSYEGLAPGFTEVLRFRLEEGNGEWEAHLRSLGIQETRYPQMYKPEGDTPDAPAVYSAKDSDTAFLTDRVIEDLSGRPKGWTALVTYIRPHPPFVAPAPYNTMYNSDDVPAPKSAEDTHPSMAASRERASIASTVVGFPDLEPSEENARLLRAIYFGLATEVDHHLGRLFDWLRKSGQYDDTLIILTSDHGEMLGDYGLWSKMTYHDAAFKVPLIIRTPNGKKDRVVDDFTESVDIAPTVLDLLGLDRPSSMDGRSLGPFLTGVRPPDWRKYSFSELDLGNPIKPTAWQELLGFDLDAANLAVLRTKQHRFVQFGGDTPCVLFDLEGEGEGQNLAEDPSKLRICLDLSRQMLCHRMQNPDGTFSRSLVTSEGLKVAAT